MTSNISKHTESSDGSYHGGEHRDNNEIHLKLRVKAIVEEQRIHHGFIKYLSLKGATLFLDHNLQNINTIKLQIHIPPNFEIQENPRVVEVSGKVLYSIYDSKEWQFRSAINFDHFYSESDRKYIESKIAHIKSR